MNKRIKNKVLRNLHGCVNTYTVHQTCLAVGNTVIERQRHNTRLHKRIAIELNRETV